MVSSESLALAERVLRSTPLIEGHNDLPWQYRQRVANRVEQIDLEDTRDLEPPLPTDLRRLRRPGSEASRAYRAGPRDRPRDESAGDLSHASADTMHDALDTSAAPVAFTHSGARGVNDYARNVPDEVLDRVRESGSIVMLTFVPYFISPAVLAHRAAQAADSSPSWPPAATPSRSWHRSPVVTFCA